MKGLCDFFFLSLQLKSSCLNSFYVIKQSSSKCYLVFEMIKSLHIENYALISRLDINLNGGFSVITGETGAGKSIILGAIGLLKGQRADVKSIKTGEKRCVVEAVFDVKSYELNDFFEENDLDFDGSECIIRRELTASGKSRAFINDTPVTASLLKTLGDKLVDVHSQHQNLLLNNEDFQINVLDIIGKANSVRKEYATLYHDYKNALASLNKAVEDSKRSHEDEDYWLFQYNQLAEAMLDDENEQDAIEAEAEMLEHAEEIRSELFCAQSILSGDNDESGNLLSSLKRATDAVDSIIDKYRNAATLAERLKSSYIELKDIAAEIETEAENVESNPMRLQQIQDRLNVIYSLQRKHNVNSIAELQAIRDELAEKINAIDNSEEMIENLKHEAEQKQAKAVEKAKGLSEIRRTAAEKSEALMVERLKSLGMPNVQFKIQIQSDYNRLDNDGADCVTFLFSANKNGMMQDVAKVASGGEVARVMLSLKSLIADAVQLPTIIFDEIDTGVSGSIADKMAEIMTEMGKNGRQVISITHLPQIAAHGIHHYRVYKDEEGESAISNIIELDENQRIEEIAHMLSGAEITTAAIANAKELLLNK